MAITKPVQVKGATISSSDFMSFASGLDERGDYNISPDAFSYGRNGSVNSANNFTHRLSKQKWLPNSVGFNGAIAPIYYNGQLYYFIADNGKIKYCQDNDTSWTDCGGSNSVTTTTGIITTFLRVNDILLVLNGTDTLRYIKLSDFTMVQFTHVNDPTAAITAAATGITASGSYKVYYAYTYNSDGGGETAISPILSQAVSKSRSTWKSDGTEYLTLTFNDTPPAGATSRNLYAAIALQGTTPVASDLAMLQANIPTSTASFVDNGSVPFNISYNTAPDTNSTTGIKASLGTLVGSTPLLYGDPDNPYDMNFGAITDTGISFGSNNGAQRLPLLKGTNFYPTCAIGFRNNQGIPNLMVLFSSTEGVSKQQIVSQKQLTYGNATVNYWGEDDLNAGAASTYGKYAAVNYLGQLLFPSSEGITSIKTDQRTLNMLTADLVSLQIPETYASIKNANFDKIIAAAWNNLVCFAIPSRGYDYNNQIAVYDLTNKDRPKWYVWDLAADWIGTVSPPNHDSFLYIRQGNEFFKLVPSYVAEDENSDGTSSAYPVTMGGNLRAFSGGKNVFYAANQAVVYLANFIGTVTVQVTYYNNKGKPKTKSKTFTNGSVARNTMAGWGNPRNLWRSFNNRVINWSTPIPTTSETNNALKTTKRCRVKLPNPVINEAKITVSSDLRGTSFDVVGGNFEGVNVGVIGDIV